MNIEELKNIVNSKELLLQVDQDLINNKKNKKLKNIFEVATTLEVVFLIASVFFILISGIEENSVILILSFCFLYLIELFLLGISGKGILANIYHKFFYKYKIKKIDDELLKKMGTLENFYNKKDIIEINKNYQLLNKEQKKFFNSCYNDYNSYIFKAVSDFIRKNNKEVVKENKEFIVKIIAEEFSGKQYNQINNLIKEKFKVKNKIKILDKKEEKENELLKSFNQDKKKIKKHIIEI